MARQEMDLLRDNIGELLKKSNANFEELYEENLQRKSDNSALGKRIDSETADRKSQDSKLSARIDNLAKLPAGSTAGDAELADIRVDFQGTVHENAGSAVRASDQALNDKIDDEVSKLKEDLEDIYSGNGKIINLESLGIIQGNIDVNTGIVDSSSYAIRTQYPMNITGSIKVSIEKGYRIYPVYYAEGKFTAIHNIKGGTFLKDGDVSEGLMNKDVYFVFAKDGFADITTSEISQMKINISVIQYMSTNNYNLGNYALSRKGAKLLPSPYIWTTIFEQTGEGILETMFFAGDFLVRRTVIRVIVDDNILSIYGYLYELIGLAADRNNTDIFGNDMFGKTGTTNGIYLNYKVPFYKNIKIEIMNDSETSNPYVWFNARTSAWHDIYVSGMKVPYGAYFYCAANSAIDIQSGVEFELYETVRNGIITNINMTARGQTSSWYQEGMIRAYIGDTSKPITEITPQLISSGLEDYFLGTYYFATGKYYLNVAGCSIIDTQNEHIFSGYRLHTHDLLCHNSGGYRLTLRNSDINVEEASDILNPTLASYRWYVGRYEW